jgi:hypothetical protein
MSQSTALQKPDKNKILETVIIKGDLSELSPADRVSYYNALCHSLKLNPLTKPFDFIEIEDKRTGKKRVVIYANKDCAAQLKTNHGVSVFKTESKIEDGCLVVTAYAKTPDGREDIDEGAVFVKGLVGESLCNARMKALTKAKRRVTLSICGLGFLDESEIDSIPGAQRVANPEDAAVMTEQEALNLSHRAIGLDQWKCGRALAMRIIGLSTTLKTRGIDDQTIKSWLPSGITSRKDLTEDQANDFIYALERRLDLFNVCGELAAKGVDSDTMKGRLPNGAQSLKDLSLPQVEDALKAFTHWFKSYNEVVEGSVING